MPDARVNLGTNAYEADTLLTDLPQPVNLVEEQQVKQTVFQSISFCFRITHVHLTSWGGGAQLVARSLGMQVT